MGLFEWLGESYFPGNVGTIKRGRKPRKNVPRYLVLINIVLSLGIFIGLYIYILSKGTEPTIKNVSIYVISFVVYGILGRQYKPEPDYNNIGIGGVPIDHPFKISDDINRLLVILKILLWPGHYMSRSVIEFYHLVKKRRSMDFRKEE